MARISAFILDPLDVLFFRDGHPFEQGMQARSGLPLPQTLYGAVITSIMNHNGISFSTWRDHWRKNHGAMENTVRSLQEHTPIPPLHKLKLRGPFLTRRSQENREVASPFKTTNEDGDSRIQWDLLLPAPGILSWLGEEEEKIIRLTPLPEGELPGWNGRFKSPLWSKIEFNDVVSGFLTPTGMSRFLQGKVPEHGDVVKPSDLYEFDRRVGIGIDAKSQTVEEGLLYGISFLSLRKDVRFYFEVEHPEDYNLTSQLLEDPLLNWGGEGKRVRVSDVLPLEWGKYEASGDGTFYTMITPGFFNKGTHPSFLEEKLQAAAVHGNLPISGWDLALGGPKPTRFAVPQGSVYFTTDRLDDPCSLVNLSDQPDDEHQGYGLALKGVWNYE